MNTDYVVQFLLNAKDNASGAFNKLSGEIQSTHASFDKLQGLLTTGVVAAFAGLIAHSISLGDELFTLHEKTGMSVESLGGLKISAEQSNTSIDALVRGSKKLSEQMADALQNPTGEAANAFRKLGMSVTDAHGKLIPLEQFIPQLADKFNQYEDGQLKINAANYLLGKSGLDLLPVFKQGGDAIRENTELYKALGGHTTASAQASDNFSDKMVVVKVAAQGVWNSIATALLPTLTKLADIYIDASKNSDKYKDSASLTTLVVKSLASVFMGLAAVFETVGTGIGAFAATLQTAFGTVIDETIVKAKGFGEILMGLASSMSGQYLEAAGHFKTGLDMINAQAAGGSATTAAKVQQIWADFKSDTAASWDKWGGRISSMWDTTTAAVVKKAPETGKGLAMPVLQAAKQIQESDYQKEIRKFENIYDEALLAMEQGFGTVTKAEQEFLKLVDSPQWAKMSAQQQQDISDKFGVANAQEHLNLDIKTFNDLAKDAAAYAKKVADEQEKWKEAINDNVAAFDDLIQSIYDQAEGIRYEGIEHDKYVARLKIEKDYAAGLIPTYNEYLDRLHKLDLAYQTLSDAEKLKEREQANLQMWANVNDAAKAVFESIFEDGENTFKRIGEALKKFLIDVLYQMTVKQWIINIGVSTGLLSAGSAAAMGGLGTSTAGSAVGGGLENMLGSAAGNYIGSAFSIGGASIGAWLTALSQGYSVAGFSAAASLGAGAAAEVGAGAAGGAAAGASTGIAAGASWIPVVGWVIAAAAILYALFGSKGGGPKSGGFAQTSGAGFERFFTPNNADSAMNQVASKFNDSYRSIVEGLGGRAISDLGFAIGFDTDPNGTADNRVSVGLSRGGVSFWQRRDQSAGRDNEDLQRVMDRSMATAMAQAIKASDLPAIVAGVWRNVGEVTQEQLQNLVKFSGALYSIQKDTQANVLDDARQIEEQAQKSAIDKYHDSAAALREMVAEYDGSEEATYKLATATSQFRIMAIQLIMAIDAVAESFKKTIAESRRSVEMTGLTGDSLQAYLQTEINNLLRDLANTTDPAKVQEIGQRINQDILQMWGVLTPEQQTTQRQHYLDWLGDIGTTVQARLDAIKAEITGDGSDSYASVMQDVGTKLSEAASGISDAADRMLAASTQMEQASVNIANGGNITITVNTTTGEVGVSGQ